MCYLARNQGLETLGTLETLRRVAQLKRVYWQSWLQNSNRESSSLGTHHAHHLSIIEWRNKILNISVSLFICNKNHLSPITYLHLRQKSLMQERGAHLCIGFHGNLQNPDQPSSPRRPIYAGEANLWAGQIG